MLASTLEDKRLPGVLFRELNFEPTFQKHAHQLCQGVQIHVTDRDGYEAVRTGLTILETMQDIWPDQFAWNPPPYEYEHDKLPIEILLGRSIGQSLLP